jgi:hypothetical protein
MSIEPRLEVVYGVDKAAVLNGHRKVDGVEVRLAVKTPCKIRAWIDGRLRLAAQRTGEDQLVVSSLVGPTQVSEEPREFDFVSQTAEQWGWEATLHDGGLLR